MRAFAVAVLVLSANVAAQVPAKLGYQGRLLRADGSPVLGTLPITFSIHAQPTGGSALWAETQLVAFSDGYYAVRLGDASPGGCLAATCTGIPAAVLDGAERYLELLINGAALLPRQQMSSVPYALRCTDARNLTGGAVSASSISVGGTMVVDSSGRLTAAAGYSAGSGIAIDHATHSISLSKSCAVDEVLRWNGASWSCVLAVGPQGATGPAGPIGPQGLVGPVGPVGPIGPRGPVGLTGAVGPIGPAGLTGVAGPVGPIGPIGPTGIAGPAGPIGPRGPVGLTGPVGPIGPTGLTGVAGPAGPIGPTGPTGVAGPAGPIGPTGPTGVAGPEGPIGPIGPAGVAGPAGPIGPIGPAGVAGPAGPIGPIGPTGVAGPAGPAGPVGPIGPAGPGVLVGFGGAFVSQYAVAAGVCDWVGAPIGCESANPGTGSCACPSGYSSLAIGGNFSAPTCTRGWLCQKFPP